MSRVCRGGADRGFRRPSRPALPVPSSGVESRLISVLIRSRLLSLVAAICTHIVQMKGGVKKKKKKLLPEAARGVYQLPCSVIVIANGFSRGLATTSRPETELAQMALMKCLKPLQETGRSD